MVDVFRVIKQLATPRMVFGLVFLYCLTMILVARLYFQGHLMLEPCPLCVMQRFFVISTAVVVLVALIHNAGIRGRRIYSALALLSSLGGLIASTRHVWLQSLPPDQVPECGPGIDYIMEVFSLSEALQMIFAGSGECSEVLWKFLGLTIPGWTLVAFAFMFAVLVFQLLRRD